MIYRIQFSKYDELVFENRKDAYAYAFGLVKEGKRRIVVGKSANRRSRWTTDGIVMVRHGVAEVHKRTKDGMGRYVLYSTGTARRL